MGAWDKARLEATMKMAPTTQQMENPCFCMAVVLNYARPGWRPDFPFVAFLKSVKSGPATAYTNSNLLLDLCHPELVEGSAPGR
jgi:hypothetical protein